MNKKTSISDIASQLGVSTTLVSLVLNGKSKENRISDDISKKVLNLARELNYHPNQLARGLRTGISKTIGLIVSDISNPFFSKIGRIIEDEADRLGYSVIFCSTDEKAWKTTKMIKVLLDKQVDGLILTPSIGNKEDIKELKRQKVPFVLIDRYFPAVKTNYAGVNNREISRIAIEHLISKNHQRIGLISIFNEMSHMQERIAGYKDALRNNKISISRQLLKEVNYKHLKKDIFHALDEIRAPGIDASAVFLATSQLGVIALEYISIKKLRIPEDIAMISFDDPELYRLHSPPITGIRQPLEKIAKSSVEVLMNEIKNKKYSYKHIILDTEFLIRNSCG